MVLLKIKKYTIIFPKSWRKKVLNIISKLVAVIYRYRLPPLIIRDDTTDLVVFRQVFVFNIYNLPIKNFNPQFIIDGGANVGYTSLWFTLKYPQAKIVSIEPEKSNYKVLAINTKRYSNISLIKAGLWNKNANLKLIDRGTGKWGFMTKEAGNKQDRDIKAVTISSILRSYKINCIDILKLDVEGAERYIFKTNYDNWLTKTKVIIIELHDRIYPDCSKTFFSAIDKYNFRKLKQGESLILINQKYF